MRCSARRQRKNNIEWVRWSVLVFVNVSISRSLTLIVLSLFAQLFMMDRDCWNLIPPIPITSAISWLTAITTWGETRTDRFTLLQWIFLNSLAFCLFCSVSVWPADVCEQRTFGPCSQNYSSWESKAGGQHRSGWSRVWSYSTSGSHNRRMHTYPHGPRKTYKGTEERKINTKEKRTLMRMFLETTGFYSLRQCVSLHAGLCSHVNAVFILNYT